MLVCALLLQHTRSIRSLVAQPRLFGMFVLKIFCSTEKLLIIAVSRELFP